MIIVSDSSPLITLARAGHLDLLRDLYEQIVIPSEVHQEVTVLGAGLPGAAEVERATWVHVQSNALQAPEGLAAACAGLGSGERSAILLASELSADLLLLDEARARRIAASIGIHIAGAVAILEHGARLKKITDLRVVYQSLIRQGIRFDRRLLNTSLRSLGLSDL